MMSHESLQQDVAAGQAVYTRGTLPLYDLVVHGISNRFIWKCPTARLVEHYNEYVTANHLEVGVGTGLLVDRCQLPAGARLVLVDLNEHCLAATAKRLARYEPRTYRRNLLEPLALDDEGPFDSVGVNYVLHCLPGDIRAKAVVLDHVAEYLNPGGVVFGSTLVGTGPQHNRLARRLMKFYNARGIFTNTQDDLAGLEESLASRFAEWGVEVVGSAALFWGRK